MNISVLNALVMVMAVLLLTGTSKFKASRLKTGGRTRQRRPYQKRSRRSDQRGEGVISAAIAVLIIASLGALMWVGFKSLWENAEATTNSEIAKIGQ